MKGLIADPSVMLILFSMLMLLGLGRLMYGSFTGKQPPQIDVNE